MNRIHAALAGALFVALAMVPASRMGEPFTILLVVVFLLELWLASRDPA